MRKLILLCSIILLVSSCITTRTERQENRRKAKCEKYGCYSGPSDSLMIIRETTTIKEDTTIYIHVPGMIVHDTLIQVQQDPLTGLVNSKKSMLQVPFATSYAWVENGRLKHELKQKDSLVQSRIMNAIRVTRIQDSEKRIKQLPPERINYLTGWQWFQVWSGRIALCILFIYILLMLIKPFFT